MHVINDYRDALETYIALNPLGKEPETLYGPAQYILGMGGKRMRPMLLLLSYAMYRDKIDPALPAALGIEVFHNFSLVHDDIMDAAAKRRGNPTVHQKFGTNSAILSGDVMLIRCFHLLLQACAGNDAQTEVLETFVETATGICEGQQLDLDFERQSEVNLEDYLHMNELKTAILLGAALRIGALLGGSPEQDADDLYDAGVEIGQAFQIQDDLLDVYGDEARTGKKRGSDIVNAKKTYLYAYTLETLTAVRRQIFTDLYNQQAANPEVKIQKVMQWFDEHQTRQSAQKMQHELYASGMDKIHNIKISRPGKALLLEFIRRLENRSD